MELPNVMHDLERELSQEEIVKFAAEAAEESHLEKLAGEDEQDGKDAAKEAKKRAEEHASEVKRLLKMVRTRKEVGEVECSQEYDYEADQIILRRVDTGKEVDRRDPRPDERQMDLTRANVAPDPSHQEQVDRTPAGA